VTRTRLYALILRGVEQQACCPHGKRVDQFTNGRAGSGNNRFCRRELLRGPGLDAYTEIDPMFSPDYIVGDAE
jgi:hypothetical protein